jgi:hypothetical protein
MKIFAEIKLAGGLSLLIKLPFRDFEHPVFLKSVKAIVFVAVCNGPLMEGGKVVCRTKYPLIVCLEQARPG